MIKTAKMQGNVMVSARRQARGRGRRGERRWGEGAWAVLPSPEPARSDRDPVARRLPGFPPEPARRLLGAEDRVFFLANCNFAASWSLLWACGHAAGIVGEGRGLSRGGRGSV